MEVLDDDFDPSHQGPLRIRGRVFKNKEKKTHRPPRVRQKDSLVSRMKSASHLDASESSPSRDVVAPSVVG